jgi:hypothetical protein
MMKKTRSTKDPMVTIRREADQKPVAGSPRNTASAIQTIYA